MRNSLKFGIGSLVFLTLAGSPIRASDDVKLEEAVTEAAAVEEGAWTIISPGEALEKSTLRIIKPDGHSRATNYILNGGTGNDSYPVATKPSLKCTLPGYTCNGAVCYDGKGRAFSLSEEGAKVSCIGELPAIEPTKPTLQCSATNATCSGNVCYDKAANRAYTLSKDAQKTSCSLK